MISIEATEDFVNAIEALFRTAGADPYKLGARLSEWLDPAHKLLSATNSRESLLAFIRELPSENEEYIPVVVTLLHRLPGIIEEDLLRVLHKFADEHPLRKLPGPPRAHDEKKMSMICDDVATLHRQGVQMRLAQERVAQRHGTSLRAVQRAWKVRDQLKSGEPRTIGDLFKVIATL